jgi:hypothetical protein
MSREIYGPAGPHMNLFLFLVIYKEEYNIYSLFDNKCQKIRKEIK